MPIGHTELLILLVVVLLIFGGKKIPELARGLGHGMREFKQAVREGDEAKGEEKKDEPAS